MRQPLTNAIKSARAELLQKGVMPDLILMSPHAFLVFQGEHRDIVIHGTNRPERMIVLQPVAGGTAWGMTIVVESALATTRSIVTTQANRLENGLAFRDDKLAVRIDLEPTLPGGTPKHPSLN